MHEQEPDQDVVHDRLDIGVHQKSRIIPGGGLFAKDAMLITSPMKDGVI